jgi:flagellar basal-body rod protein FlgB
MALTSPLRDTTTTTLHAALRGLAARQRVHAQNVANVETPGYTARRVEFESALRRAVDAGTPGAVAPTTTKTNDLPGANGNNVQLDMETMALTETGLRYQLMTQAMDARFKGLRNAIGRGA